MLIPLIIVTDLKKLRQDKQISICVRKGWNIGIFTIPDEFFHAILKGEFYFWTVREMHFLQNIL
jgi:hypothetical protein